MGTRHVARSAPLAPVPAGYMAGGTYDSLDPQTKEAIDTFMETLSPDIEKKAVELLKNEIRDKIVRTGDIAKIMDHLKKGKKAKLIRKKGCIFIQFGTGDPDDEMDEFLVAST